MASVNHPDPEVVDKERAALELRRGGATYDAIARQLGYAHPSGAAAAYQRALKRTLMEAGSEEVRAAELDRLDRLQLAHWSKAIAGDGPATDRVLRIMEHRARYLGLYAPARVQMEAVVYDAGTIEGEVQRLRLLLEADSGEPSVLGGPEGETGAITYTD